MELNVFKIQRTGLKTRPEVPSKTQKKKKNKKKKRELKPGSEVYFENKNGKTRGNTSVRER